MSARSPLTPAVVAVALLLGAGPAGAARQGPQKNRAEGARTQAAGKAVKSKASTTSTVSRAKNVLLARYARWRRRDAGGRFVNRSFGAKVIRTRTTATALANKPSWQATSKTTVEVSPPRGKRAGRIRIDIPDFRAGDSLTARTQDIGMPSVDIRGDRVYIRGKLKIRGGRPGDVYRRATFEGEIPAGARMSRQLIEYAITNSVLQVNTFTIKWSGAE